MSASTCSSPWHLSIAEHFELFCLPFQLPPSDVFSALCPHLSLFLLGWLKHTAWAPGAAMGEEREQKCCMDVITENISTRDKVQKRFGMKCRTGAFTPENSGPCTEARHCQGGCISAEALPVGRPRCPGEVTEAGWLISSSLLTTLTCSAFVCIAGRTTSREWKRIKSCHGTGLVSRTPVHCSG